MSNRKTLQDTSSAISSPGSEAGPAPSNSQDGEAPVWTGSCPCQPLSGAGLGKGHADERHVWPAFHRLIAECKPSTVIGEQVASSLGREWLCGVRADLEALGYACGAADLCAAGAGAPHIRQRLFWVADAEGGKAGKYQYSNGDHSKPVLNLEGAVELVDWATPTAPRKNDSDLSAFRWNPNKKQDDAVMQIIGRGEKLSNVPMEKRGALNPAFSRWLMGYPVEWCQAAIKAYRKKKRTPRRKPES